MFVRDLATRNVVSCLPETDLASAAALFWEHDCGILPVVDRARKVVGVLTDRDICMALATRGKLASQLCARDVMSHDVHTALEEDAIGSALKALRHHRVRRLPVVDGEGRLKGLLSMNDLFLAARPEPGAIPSYEDVVHVMKGICAHSPEAARAKGQLALA